MHTLKKTGTDFISAQGMDPKKFFEVMGKSSTAPEPEDFFMCLTVLEQVKKLSTSMPKLVVPHSVRVPMLSSFH